MLERLQSALRTVKDSKPPSLMSHRFVTVRRGSPAARSGQIQPGDQLEAVEGRPVEGLQHRDLAQILRRAGNMLRLSIMPKHHSSLSEGADLDIDGRVMKGSRGRSKDESRFYSVDLERGPTGFGFSLRGGSEYNMGLYVLGLMEGGPAQRSNKIQVSDQLVEINGDSTTGMTHSQAVEQIQKGGHQIHLILKKGNGYVPDYGPEEGALSLSSSHTEKRNVDMVTKTTASLSWQRGEGHIGVKGGGERRRREGETKQQTGRGGGLGPPDLDLDQVQEKAWEEEQRRDKGLKERRQLEKEERRRKEEEEDRKRKGQTVRQKKQDDQREQGRRSRSLPRNGAGPWHTLLPEEGVEMEEMGGGARERKRRSEMKSGRKGREADREKRDVSATLHAKHSGSSAAAQRAVFSFLMPMDDDMPQRQSDTESAASFSEISESAASIATMGWREDLDWIRAESSWRQENTPGPWLKPSPHKLTQVLIGSRLGGRGLAGGLSL